MFNFRQSQMICGFQWPTKGPEIFLNKLINVNLLMSCGYQKQTICMDFFFTYSNFMSRYRVFPACRVILYSIK